MERVAVLGWARTAFGRFGGELRDVRLPVLGSQAVAQALARAQVRAEDVNECAIGVNFPGSDRSVARQTALRAGIPDDRDAYTVDRACCSSLTAIAHASRGIRLGETGIAVAGGADNLSRVPYFLESMRFGHRLGDIVLSDQLIISCPYTGVPRAVQAADEAREHGVDRAAQDDWALRSQDLYQQALHRGFFAQEIVPALDDQGRVLLDHDECPRPQTTASGLAGLPTVNGSSTVTAGNAPNMATGASAVVLADPAHPLAARATATIEAWTRVAGHPARIASIPAEAARQCLGKAGLGIEDVHHWEINEAFAAVPLVTTLVLAEGDPGAAERLRVRVNPNGGSIALGHPTGATAARLVMTTIAALRERGGGIGVVAICGGVGEAEAVLVRVSEPPR